MQATLLDKNFQWKKELGLYNYCNHLCCLYTFTQLNLYLEPDNIFSVN